MSNGAQLPRGATGGTILQGARRPSNRGNYLIACYMVRSRVRQHHSFPRWSRISRSVSGAIVFLGAISLMSCHAGSDSLGPFDALGPVPDGAFTTDATGYVAGRLPGQPPRYRFTVISRFHNRGAATLYLGRCYPNSPRPLFGVTLAAPAPEESAYDGIWACTGHDKQFAIRPGEVRIDTLQVEGPNAFDGITNEPFGVTEGDFRLYFDVRLAPGDGPPAPDALMGSNAFRVRTSG